ncbi:MAG: hypothetical protein J6L77_04120 [Coprococcus sp.]|nr:hypothetical protein [Coprococcus sp.]
MIKLNLKKPLVGSFPVYSDVFALMPDGEEALHWLCNNFIQIRYFTTVSVIFFEQYRSLLDTCPFLTHFSCSREIIKNEFHDIHNYAEKMIRQEHYVFLYVDRYYISGYEEYKVEHHLHEILLYGFDEKEKIYYCADNIGDGRFGTLECKYEEFEAAYDAIHDVPFHQNVHLLRLGKWWDVKDEPIRMERIVTLLDDYVNSYYMNNPQEPFTEMKYGFNIHYEILHDLEEEHRHGDMDVRAMCTLYEQKQLMTIRFKYLYEKDPKEVYKILAEFFEGLEKEYYIIRNCITRYIAIQNSPNSEVRDAVYSKIVRKFQKCIEDEKKIWEKIKFTKVCGAYGLDLK